MSDENELLSLLETHGQQFLQSFDFPSSIQSIKRRAENGKANPSALKRAKLAQDEPSSEEEWGGIQLRREELSSENNNSNTGSDLGDSDFEQDDDGFTAGSSTVTDGKTIVFSENKFRNEGISKAEMKAFMSSKVSKLRGDGTLSSQQSKKKTPQEEEEDRTNAENDALLHRLVHTQLLSGSLNPELNMTPAHRRKALAGRVMELAEGAKLGKGEKVVRESERNKAGKRVREGLAQKQRKQERQDLEKAKDLGNYHPTLKKLFEAPGNPVSRSKARGLKMGVGKFRGGVLQLSKQEIASVAGGSQRSNRKEGHKRR
ncbi:hypothetical protein D9756_000703 [Leucocoprinus leucothites]|uniref:Uncharacterized protein n=1 Tax=Leucocoprinus leucothites TaxID=201217 RepID=A0A8H5LNG6_9AGAR|nr:hypothetical protein D9756_000703 [Leucoagaricus leucothites]